MLIVSELTSYCKLLDFGAIGVVVVTVPVIKLDVTIGVLNTEVLDGLTLDDVVLVATVVVVVLVKSVVRSVDIYMAVLISGELYFVCWVELLLAWVVVTPIVEVISGIPVNLVIGLPFLNELDSVAVLVLVVCVVDIVPVELYSAEVISGELNFDGRKVLWSVWIICVAFDEYFVESDLWMTVLTLIELNSVSKLLDLGSNIVVEILSVVKMDVTIGVLNIDGLKLLDSTIEDEAAVVVVVVVVFASDTTEVESVNRDVYIFELNSVGCKLLDFGWNDVVVEIIFVIKLDVTIGVLNTEGLALDDFVLVTSIVVVVIFVTLVTRSVEIYMFVLTSRELNSVCWEVLL